MKPSYAVTFVLCCFSMLASSLTFADEILNKAFQIKVEETQLAKRFAVREAVESPFEYSLSVGDRHDDFRWSIADGNVDVASEVHWENTAITQLRAAAKINLWRDWLLRGIFSTGAVRSGRNQDSDYAGSNRTQEFSRSNNKSGGAVRDLSIGLGNKIKLFNVPDVAVMHVSPLAGLSIHQQNMTMYDGQQIIPTSGALTELNSNYDTQWKGSWLGLDGLLKLGRNVFLNTTAEYHWVDYTAKANWNLRGDLAHPVSFKHVANGRGIVVSAGIAYRFGKNFLVNAAHERQRWSTDVGYDETHFSYGATNYYTLNSVSLKSRIMSLGVAYQF